MRIRRVLDSIRHRARRGVERERNLERPLEAFSKKLWPWHESRLALFVSLLAVLDYISTYAALKLSGSNQVYEAGPLAGWALRIGGFPELLVIDTISIGVLILLAVGARFFYARLGFPGFGRTAFVFLLIPYSVVIMAVVINNILLTFL